MIFRTKRDRFFAGLWAVLLLIVNLPFFIPLFVEESTGSEIGTLLGVNLATSALLLWLAVDIRYVIQENMLLVRGGPFRSKIQIQDITEIKYNPNIWVGYRVLSSKEAIEIFYRTGFMGSVIISPVDPDRFIQELSKRNPTIKVHEKVTTT